RGCGSLRYGGQREECEDFFHNVGFNQL
ncbi:MAG: hypothetical protein K0R43_2887, partial [Pseudoduganella sp.]|nr:hypothetical protein [Pseudoduganella sp.]